MSGGRAAPFIWGQLCRVRLWGWRKYILFFVNKASMSFSVHTASWWQQDIVLSLTGKAVNLTTGYPSFDILNKTVIASRMTLLENEPCNAIWKRRNFRWHGGPQTQARKETSKTGWGGAPDGTGWLQRELPNTGEAGTDSSVNTCKWASSNFSDVYFPALISSHIPELSDFFHLCLLWQILANPPHPPHPLL